MTNTFGLIGTRITKKQVQQTALALLVIAALIPLTSTAGGDTTFTGISTLIRGWMEGSLGKVLALAGFAIALASGIVKGSAIGVVLGLAIALAAAYGPGILETTLTLAM